MKTKQLFALLVAIATLLSFTACSKGAKDADASLAQAQTPKVTAVPTPTPEPTPTPLPYISWKECKYVDEWGEANGETYIQGSFSGTYSNKYSSNEYLKVFMAIQPQITKTNGYITFYLEKNGSTRVSIKNGTPILIKAKINGKEYKGTLKTSCTASYIYLESTKETSAVFWAILDALDNNTQFSIWIGTGGYVDYGLDSTAEATYLFKVDSYGLESIWHYWSH